MNNLLRLIGNRLIWLPIMIFGVTVLVFFLMSLSPIDQAYSALGENASAEQLALYREQHGLDDPVVVQYCNYMVGFFHGDLGTFGPANQSVAGRIATALPITLQLGFFGFIIAIVASAILGVVSALYRDRCCMCSPHQVPSLRSRRTRAAGLPAWRCPASRLPSPSPAR